MVIALSVEGYKTMRGMNINGEGFISGAKYVEDKEAFIARNRARYKKTPISIPDKVPNGSYRHVGKGVWLKRCSECNIYELTYGALAYVHVIDTHTHKAHGIDVVGVNIAMLPKILER